MQKKKKKENADEARKKNIIARMHRGVCERSSVRVLECRCFRPAGLRLTAYLWLLSAGESSGLRLGRGLLITASGGQNTQAHTHIL